MVLTDTQIERYSRQIIVPGVGGRAQERLLAARVAIVAAAAYASGAVAYLAGAGVGSIVVHPVGDGAPYRAMVEQIGDLNPDVSAEIASDEMPNQCDLMLALIGDARAAEAAARIAREHCRSAAIVARLDTPGRIALLPAPPPCPLCADADLLSPPRDCAGNAGAIAMVAVAEAFRLLAGFAGQQPEGQLIEFDGYASRSRALHPRRRMNSGGEARCVCEAAAS
jgi:hypothetical protein